MPHSSLARRTFEWPQLRVALLAVVGILLLIFAVYRVGQVFDVFAARYEVVTLVPSALGLREGAPVTLAGQRIGQVSRIEFIPPGQKVGENNLLLRLALSEEVRDQIRSDSRVFLRTQGLLGDKFVDIQPGSPHAAILTQGDTLIAGRTVDIDEFMAQAASAMDTALLVVRSIRRVADGIAAGEGTLGRLLVDDRLYMEVIGTASAMRTTLAQLNRPDGTFGRLVHDPALYENLTGAVARLDSVAALAMYGEGTIGRLLRDDTLHNSLLGTVERVEGSLISAVARADTAMAQITDFLARMTEGDGTVQRLFTDPALYDELLKAIIDVQSLINAIRVDPERYRPDVRVRVF
jgi:phospholipid/cholesterol/gamma-HCH transport system substrate-binding protein